MASYSFTYINMTFSFFQAGVSMHSTKSFSMHNKEGRCDTSAWTDSPLDKTQKTQQGYMVLA
jgi:hypothetical protein